MPIIVILMMIRAWITSADPPSDANMRRPQRPTAERTLNPARTRKRRNPCLTSAIRELFRGQTTVLSECFQRRGGSDAVASGEIMMINHAVDPIVLATNATSILLSDFVTLAAQISRFDAQGETCTRVLVKPRRDYVGVSIRYIQPRLAQEGGAPATEEAGNKL